jgi:hypothetical protein
MFQVFLQRRTYLVSIAFPINSFRNKLAHVPVPHRVLGDLHQGLRTEVLSLLSPAPQLKTRDPQTIKWHPPLAGRIHAFGLVLSGAKDFESRSDEDGAVSPQDVLVEPELTVGLTWSARPFFHVDEELKVSMLLLLKGLREDPTGDSFDGEYHRFAAEFRPIQEIEISGDSVSQLVPRPASVTATVGFDSRTGETTASQHSAETGPTESPATEAPRAQTSRELRTAADEAFRVRDFHRALDLYEQLARTQDPVAYNDVARSKHGGALWRVAERNGLATRVQDIQRAVELLREASGHRDPSYRARSLYEQSKALWHLWRLDRGNNDLLEQARAVAGEAARIENDPTFIRWHDRVNSDLDFVRQESPIQGTVSNKAMEPAEP